MHWNAKGDIAVLVNEDYVQTASITFGRRIGTKMYDRNGIYIAEFVGVGAEQRIMVNLEEERLKRERKLNFSELPYSPHMMIEFKSQEESLFQQRNTTVPVKDGYRDFEQKDIEAAEIFQKKIERAKISSM